MSCARTFVAIVAVLFLAAAAVPGYAQQRLPDSTLFTTYYSNGNPATQINWSTCGSTQQTEGCYGSGSFGGFTNACSIVQSVPAPLNINTVVRYIYILDQGATSSGATLSAYKRTDMVTATFDNISITHLATIPLANLNAGPGSSCAMVQNPTYVFATTYQTTAVALINKATFGVNYLGGLSPNVSSLTADSYGYVTIDFGSGSNASFAVFGPNGQTQESGGGAYWMINPIDGVNPTSFPAFDAASLPPVEYHPKAGK